MARPYKFHDPKSLVGIEVEVENVMYIDPNIPLGFWQISEDGSLRNNGREFKTHALPLAFVEAALTQLSRGLNPSVDFSIRTSVHVHQDVRGLTFSQLMGLILTYTAVESLLFKFAGNNRRNSIYCVPISDTDLFYQFTDRQTMFKTLRRINTAWNKYAALNLIPIMSFGTVEYRHMPGTLEVKKLLIWLDLLSRIKVWAYKKDLQEISNLISNLNSNSQYFRFLEQVFGELVTFLDQSNLIGDMERAVYLVKNATITNDFHAKILKEKPVVNSQLSVALGFIPLEAKIGAKKYKLFEQWAAMNYPGQNLNLLYDTIASNVALYIKATKASAVLKYIFLNETPTDEAYNF